MTQKPRTPSDAKRLKQQKLSRRAIWLFVTALVAGTLTIPAAFILMPHVKRWEQISNLTSPDLQKREIAMAYVATRGGDDGRIVEGAISKLDVEDRDNFLHIANALDLAGRWHHPPVPADPWLRWLTMLAAADDDKNARILAAQKLADAPDLAGDARTIETLAKLLADDDVEVRYNALVSAADLAGKSQGETRDNLVAIIAPLSADHESEIARQSWIFLGLLNAARNVEYAPEQLADPLVGQSIIWAVTRSAPGSPGSPDVAIQILDSRPDPSDENWQKLPPSELKFDPQLQAMATYGLSFSNSKQAGSALSELYPQDHPFFASWLGPWDDMTIWRAALVSPYREQWEDNIEFFSRVRLSDVGQQKLMHDSMPAIMRARFSVVGPHVATFEDVQTRYALDPLMTLAWLEGVLQLGETRPIVLPDDADKRLPAMVRLFATAAAESPKPAWIRDVFNRDEAAMRDLACVVAADRFDEAAIDKLIESLLTDYNDNGKMSGAILAGLTKRQSKLLIKAESYEDVWSVKQVLRLGLWMQGLEPQMDLLAAALLTREDLPTSTVLLALFDKGRPEAFEYLLTPRGDERTLSPFSLGLEKRQAFVLPPIGESQESAAEGDRVSGQARTYENADDNDGNADTDNDQQQADGKADAAMTTERPTHPQPLPEREGGDAAASNETQPNDDTSDEDLADLPESELPAASDVVDSLKRSEPVALVRLLDELRWWYVLDRYLPEDAPRFDVWGDPLLMQFQIDTLRNWYLLERQAAGTSFNASDKRADRTQTSDSTTSSR